MILIEQRGDYLKIEINDDTLKFSGIFCQNDKISEEDFEKLELIFSMRK